MSLTEITETSEISNPAAESAPLEAGQSIELVGDKPNGPITRAVPADLLDPWQCVVKVLESNYKNPDLQAARLICSAVAAHTLRKSPPAWALVIAPPGSMKTDMLESLRGLDRVRFVDEITPNTFLSGKVDEPGKKSELRKTPASLLHRMGEDGILVAADFSTYTADPKKLQVVLGQLRRIYDGNYSREFGTEEHLEEREWDGRLTFLAGAVPDIDRHHELFQKLGERFLRIRLPRAGGVEAGLRAIDHTDEVVEQLRRAVGALLQPILSAPQVAPVLADEMKSCIANLSELIALARSHVERDRFTRGVVDAPVTEGNTRLPQQLCQIARGSALLDGRSTVNEADFRLVRRAAFDSLPPARRAVLEALLRGERPHATGLPKSTVSRALEDLRLVGVLRPEDPADLSELARRLLEQAKLPRG
jgi:hypothetical protein